MRILVTGAAGFIGFNLVRALCETGESVFGIDNINNYYSIDLKHARLSELGIAIDEIEVGKIVQSHNYSEFQFCQMDICDKVRIDELFNEQRFDVVVNLAARGGVRYSIENPYAYIESNIIGFLNILAASRINMVSHLVYASSSSVYGGNTKLPFEETDRVDDQVSVYGATKRSNELMARVYSRVYGLPTTGLRFFTVYGPWGRPDMSPFLFIDSILRDRPIKVFNNGDLVRDFTYIDDVVEGLKRIISVVPDQEVPASLLNVGNEKPMSLIDYIECIERTTGKKGVKEYMPMQPGDVYQTYADTTLLANTVGFRPDTDIQTGIDRTVEWYRHYHSLLYPRMDSQRQK